MTDHEVDVKILKSVKTGMGKDGNGRMGRERGSMNLGFDDVKAARKKVVGTKQTIKAINQGDIDAVVVASDAEDKVTSPIIELCEDKGIRWGYMNSMDELGRACGIKVGAAAAALIGL